MAKFIVWRYEVPPGAKPLSFNIEDSREVKFYFPNEHTLFVVERTQNDTETPTPPEKA
jgi:hypothetical protein